jgi:hypothetical protein
MTAERDVHVRQLTARAKEGALLPREIEEIAKVVSEDRGHPRGL